MASVGLPSLSLVFALLLLSPGFVAVKLVKWRGKITDETDRFDKAIYTVIASGFSISVVILIISAIQLQFPESTINSNYDIWEMCVGFLGTVSVASGTGYGIGWYIDEKRYEGIDNRKESVWELIYDNADEPREVRIVTTEDVEVHGYIYVNDEDPHGQDILLQYPQRIIREGGEIKSKISIGEYVFISESEISHIYFETEIKI